MTGFIAVPKALSIESQWLLNSRCPSHNLYIDGLYWHKAEVGVDIYLLGSPFLDYTSEQSIDSLLDDMLRKVQSGNLAGLKHHGFATVIAVTDTHLYIATDSDNYRTFYLYQTGVGTAISSKIDFLNLLPGYQASLNTEELDFSLIFGYVPFDKTVVANVRKAKAGTVYEFESTGELNTIAVETENSSTNQVTLEQSIKLLHQHISDSIKSLKQIDNKVGILLGGFDSALIVAMAVEAGMEVETFSFYYEDAKYNQGKVDDLAKIYGFKHHWVPVKDDVVREGLREYSRLYSTPSNWPHYIIQSDYLAAKVKSLGFKAVLTGDGCDGLFQGYPQLYRSAKLYNENPSVALVSKLIKVLINNELSEKSLGHVYRLIMRVYRNAHMKNPEKTYLMYRICDEASVARLRGLSERDIESSVLETVDRTARDLKDISYTKLAYLGRSNMGPNRTKINGIIDNNDLYLFSPYMHWKVKSFVNSLPEEFLRPGSKSSLNDIGKYVLVRMAEKYELLTDDIIHQPKMAAVDAPMDDWYERELNDYVQSQLEATNLVKNLSFAKALAKPKMAEKLYRKYLSGDSITSHFLSILLTTISFEQSDVSSDE